MSYFDQTDEPFGTDTESSQGYSNSASQIRRDASQIGRTAESGRKSQLSRLG